jgi:hypothetical protein
MTEGLIGAERKRAEYLSYKEILKPTKKYPIPQSITCIPKQSTPTGPAGGVSRG